MPSAFSITLAFLPSITATQELVVPRSIPMTFPMVLMSFYLRQVGQALDGALDPDPQRQRRYPQLARRPGPEPHRRWQRTARGVIPGLRGVDRKPVRRR